MQRTVVTVIDDHTGNPIKDGDHVRITLAIDGKVRVLDLSSKSAKEFHADVGPWFESASPEPTARKRGAAKGSAASAGAASAQQIRDWANDNGYTVSPRGRIPFQVVDAYREAHNL